MDSFRNIAWVLLLGGFSFPHITQADLVVRDVHSTGTIANLAAVDALLSGVGIASENTVNARFIDYRDAQGGGGVGHFGNNLAFPNDNPSADDNDFAIHATGRVFIPTAGDWTFGVSSDDGSRLLIDGTSVITDNTLHPVQDFFGTANLSIGWHDLDFVFFERGGGAAVELFAAQGNHTSFSVSGFQLIGDVANGGLMTCPEPSSFILVCLAACGMLGFRKSRAQLS